MSTNPRNRQQLLHDLSQLIPPTREPPTLRREDPLPPIPARRGYIERNNQPGTSTAGGIASPLREGAAAGDDPALPVWDREFYEPIRQVVSSDGLFFWEWQELKTLRLRDANGQTVRIELAQEPEDE